MPDAIILPEDATMADYQRYVHELEAMHGWLDVDLVHSGFLMTEEVGELFKAIRKYERLFPQKEQPNESSTEATAAAADEQAAAAEQLAADEQARRQARDNAAEEIVDVLNYLLAIANRLDVDVEQAFRAKNARNQQRRWG